MASSKESQSTSRPLSQNRLSGNSLPKSVHARAHSHSVSSGSSHKITRRKSVTSNAAGNMSALVQALRESGEVTAGIPISNRRNTMSKSARSAIGSLPSPPPSLPGHKFRPSAKADRSESAIDDEEQMDDDMDEDEESAFKENRMRRASEGQHLVKDGKKSKKGDIKCEKCGKGYKHSSCLSKHLWEHTPQWSVTSKLLISKHQQVQLLEAASVLLAMNANAESTPPETANDMQSDQDSASPAASGSDEPQDGMSSAETTPPPPHSDIFNYGRESFRDHKRYSSGNNYSRSYQSAPSTGSVYSGSVPSVSGFGHYRQPSQERRPLSTEDESLAAAVGLLSCSIGSNGTPRSIPVTLPHDAPPVPSIPAQFLDQGAFSGSTLTPSHHPRQTESYTRHHSYQDVDVKMEESEESVADEDDYDHHSRGRSDEDDDGVFGRMEE